MLVHLCAHVQLPHRRDLSGVEVAASVGSRIYGMFEHPRRSSKTTTTLLEDDFLRKRDFSGLCVSQPAEGKASREFMSDVPRGRD